MVNKKKPLTPAATEPIVDEDALFARVAEIIESRKARARAYANREITLIFWEVGEYKAAAQQIWPSKDYAILVVWVVCFDTVVLIYRGNYR
jgi:hypothetical protein